MDYAEPWAVAIAFLILMIMEFIFYGFGAAIQNMTEKDIERENGDHSERTIAKVRKIMNDSSQYVNTVQLVTTSIILISGCVYVRYLRRCLQWNLQYPIPAYVIAFLLMLYMILTFGVYIPKRLGRRYPCKWAFACIHITYGIMMLCTPLTWIYSRTGNLILRLFGVRRTDRETDVTEDEIISMVNEGHEQGVLEDSEAAMIHNIIEFGDTEVHDIMTNRQNVIALPIHITLDDAIRTAMEKNNSRYPVYDENMDHIIGIVHFRDMLRFRAQLEKEKKLNTDKITLNEMRDVIREAIFVPETKKIDDLFKQMQREKQQMAIIMDEYGQTAGIVAMEDILEEIVGNIEDEYDEEEQHIEEKGQNQYVIEGMTTLEELEEKFGIDFGEQEFTTLNGFLIAKLDRIPEEDEEFSVTVGDYQFTSLSVKDNVIQEVLVIKNETKEI